MRGRDGRFGIRPSLFAFLGLCPSLVLPGLERTPAAPFGWGAAAVEAQDSPAGTVIGRITEAGTGSPQIGAFVTLLGPDGERRTAVLTDEVGRYVLRVPVPGRYRLRVEGLGVSSTLGGFFEFAAGEVREENLQVQPAALNIEGLEVTGSAQCELGRGDGTATLRLWDEARKALEVAQWIDEVGYVYEITTVNRALAGDGEQVIQEARADKTLVGQSPFVSLDAETLMTRGFVIPDETGATYYGPDAGVLLSDSFLTAHCFQAVRDEGRLGLAFRPREGREVPDIEGTLWFMEEGILDRLDYGYTGVAEYEGSEALGGEIEFRRLPNGAWIVQEWAIRMPAATMASSGGGAPRLTRILETGAVVQSARGMARVDAVFGEEAGAVRGRIEVPGLPGPQAARVYLSGTSYATLPGPDGTFLLEGLPPGTYSLIVDHPSLRPMGEAPRTRSIQVLADSMVSVEEVLPTRDEVLAERCEGTDLVPLDIGFFREDPIEAVGGVVRTTDGRGVAGRPVRVWWRYWPWSDRGGTTRSGGRGERTVPGGHWADWSGTVLRTDARGAWVVCGVPEREILYVDVPRLGLSDGEIEAGEGLGTEIQIDPLSSGVMRWVDLVVADEGQTSSGNSRR